MLQTTNQQLFASAVSIAGDMFCFAVVHWYHWHERRSRFIMHPFPMLAIQGCTRIELWETKTSGPRSSKNNIGNKECDPQARTCNHWQKQDLSMHMYARLCKWAYSCLQYTDSKWVIEWHCICHVTIPPSRELPPHGFGSCKPLTKGDHTGICSLSKNRSAQRSVQGGAP